MDERFFLYRATGLLRWRAANWPDHPWREQGLRLRESRERFLDIMPAGLVPYFAGPNIYVYDRGALGDALTARLPVIPGPWRTGHYWRKPPDGYIETMISGVNEIHDKKIAEYYGHLVTVTRGSLWDPARLHEIVAFNRGDFNYLLKP